MCVVRFGVCSGVSAKHSWCVVGVVVVAAESLCFAGVFVLATKLFLCHVVTLKLLRGETSQIFVRVQVLT